MVLKIYHGEYVYGFTQQFIGQQQQKCGFMKAEHPDGFIDVNAQEEELKLNKDEHITKVTYALDGEEDSEDEDGSEEDSEAGNIYICQLKIFTRRPKTNNFPGYYGPFGYQMGYQERRNC